MTGRLFQFMDFDAKDFTTIYPDITPGIGGVWFARWDQWNPNQGEYNVALVRKWLVAESKNKLKDGSPKPLICFILTHTAPDGTNAQGVDYSPGWVKAACPSLTATAANGTTATMPRYNDTRWWGYLTEAVRAFALETDGQAQIAYVGIGHGCDGELWAMKAPWNNKLPGGTERTFGEQTVKLLDVYKQAYTRTPLVVRATPGSGRKLFVQEGIARGIGYHFCGMQAAAQNAHGWGNEYGTWDGLVDAKAADCPALAETTFGMGNESFAYWSILGMLGMHVDAMDVHPEWLSKVSPDVWNFAIRHMGVTAETTPGAWCVLRDYDSSYPPVQWTGSNGVISGQSDWEGDFEFFMARTSSDSTAKRVENVGPSDAPESRQCRLVTSAEFAIDDGVTPPPYELSIRWLNEAGAALRVEHGAYAQEIISDGSGVWQTAHMKLTARQFKVTSSGAHIHMLYASPIEEQPEPPGPPEPGPELDTDALWTAVQGCQEDVDEALRAAYQAHLAVGNACQHITAAIKALEDAVAEMDNAQARAQTAIDRCDAASEHLAEMRETLEAAE